MRVGLMVTAAIAFGLVVYSELYEYKRQPIPARFIKLAAIWAVLGWVADFGAPQIALAFAVGILGSMLFTYLKNGQFLFTKIPTDGGNAEGNTAERRA